ncbi:MAG: hypothetical protein AAF449_14820 [Myxococcota bacterium]
MRIQFEKASDLFLAFPTLESDMVAKPTDHPVLDFMAHLLEGETPEDAITFFSYLAPKREAVWWACRCARLLNGNTGLKPAVALAEVWVRTPEEEHRRAALDHAEAADSGVSDTWAAYGAGWSGGNIAPDGNPPILAAPQLTAKAVRASVLIAISEDEPRTRQDRLKRCYAEALRLANHDTEAELS